MTRLAAFTVVLALSANVAFAEQWQPLTINSQTVGGLTSHKTAALRLPKGQGPFAAVVILPGCQGVRHETRQWARRIASWGYAALIVDSFGPRGLKNVCHRGGEMPGPERARDAFAAADYLRSRPDIDAEHMGLLGYSHGGWTALAAASTPTVAQDSAKPFSAVVAYYPICAQMGPFASDVQILIGGADDWSSPQHCEDMVAKFGGAPSHRPLLKVYPDATHSFDVDRPTRQYLGHRLAYDAKATADALEVTRQFLDSHLRR